MKTSEIHPICYVAEVGINLNPRINHGQIKKGVQTTILIPGKSQNRCLAEAPNTTAGILIWAEQKNSEIFILLLTKLRKRYKQRKKITLIADNFVKHKSALPQCFLKCNYKFEILCHPVCPRINKIEVLWKQLHDSITRNHRCPTINTLMASVRTFIKMVSAYPGSLCNYCGRKQNGN